MVVGEVGMIGLERGGNTKGWMERVLKCAGNTRRNSWKGVEKKSGVTERLDVHM